MSKMIKAGTLCIVYRIDHKCVEPMIGRIIEYDPVRVPHPGLRCDICKTKNIVLPGTEPMSWSPSTNGFGRCAIPARWLKPLPPLDEPVETERETVA